MMNRFGYEVVCVGPTKDAVFSRHLTVAAWLRRGDHPFIPLDFDKPRIVKSPGDIDKTTEFMTACAVAAGHPDWGGCLTDEPRVVFDVETDSRAYIFRDSTYRLPDVHRRQERGGVPGGVRRPPPEARRNRRRNRRGTDAHPHAGAVGRPIGRRPDHDAAGGPVLAAGRRRRRYDRRPTRDVAFIRFAVLSGRQSNRVHRDRRPMLPRVRRRPGHPGSRSDRRRRPPGTLEARDHRRTVQDDRQATRDQRTTVLPPNGQTPRRGPPGPSNEHPKRSDIFRVTLAK